jgi:hypothetical protein
MPPASIPPVALDALAGFLARLLRALTAEALLSVLSVVTSEAIDKLSLLEGRPPSSDLRREVSSCLAAAVYRAASATGSPHRKAIAVVEAACRRAASTEGSFATDIGRYIASHTPTNDLASRLAEALDATSEELAIRAALAPHYALLHEHLSALALDLA